MPAGDFFQLNAATAFFNTDTAVLPTELFIAAFTTSTTRTGGGTEVVTNGADGGIGYARAVIPTSGAFFIFNNFSLLNTAIDFNVATGDWGDIVAFSIVTSATGALANTVVIFGDLSNQPVTIDTGDLLRTGSGGDFTVQIV